MRGNASNSTTLSMKLPKMIEGDFDPHFSIKHMLKDMQIASRLGLFHHLEFGVTSAARDRLLEQMQRGHGGEDYSAIIRKYFPDIRPARSEQVGLELFEAQPAPASTEPVIEDEQPSNIIQSFPTTPEQTMGVHGIPAPAVASAEAAEAKAEFIGSTPPSESAAQTAEEDAQQQRGFFGRLLRRASN
jgi:hypothetical protein